MTYHLELSLKFLFICLASLQNARLSLEYDKILSLLCWLSFSLASMAVLMNLFRASMSAIFLKGVGFGINFCGFWSYIYEPNEGGRLRTCGLCRRPSFGSCSEVAHIEPFALVGPHQYRVCQYLRFRKPYNLVQETIPQYKDTIILSLSIRFGVHDF